MITIKIDEQELLDMFVERVRYWTKDEDEIKLFEKMYDDYIWNGVFTDGEVDIMSIVDNDWVNYTAIIRKDDQDFEKLLKVYKEEGCCYVGDKTNKIARICYVSKDNDGNTVYLCQEEV